MAVSERKCVSCQRKATGLNDQRRFPIRHKTSVVYKNWLDLENHSNGSLREQIHEENHRGTNMFDMNEA